MREADYNIMNIEGESWLTLYWYDDKNVAMQQNFDSLRQFFYSRQINIPQSHKNIPVGELV